MIELVVLFIDLNLLKTIFDFNLLNLIVFRMNNQNIQNQNYQVLTVDLNVNNLL